MSSLSSVNTPAGTLPPEDIHASFIALLGSMLGLLVTGIGMVWYWRDLLSTGSVDSQLCSPRSVYTSGLLHTCHSSLIADAMASLSGNIISISAGALPLHSLL